MDTLSLLYFSPTQTTQRILTAIGEGLAAAHTLAQDLTFAPFTGPLPPSQLLLVGVPVYGGRIPEIVYPRLAQLDGQGVPTVAVVLYGNRAYEDALLELADLLRQRGCQLVAAGAFIGEHSYSTAEHPTAANRPDESDLAQARAFGRQLAQHRQDGQFGTPVLPGQFPYKERKPSSGLVPQTEMALCLRCLACVEACPTGAISADEPGQTDSTLCIGCAACIKACDVAARAYQDPYMLALSARLSQQCQVRLEPELFF
ncbi:4Fe-4S binding protein [Pseudaeromonas sp. ZJS20]|uniref:4Fe-4S binding protein n=1 Tax=Pseudaeromonas aegiceratis TaxID=3153928 RepID=UPI00390C9D0D